jgi:hypothetical protein
MGRVAAIKRVSLEGLYDGWGPDCYALVKQANYEDMIELESQKGSKAEVSRWQEKFVAERFVSGKLLIVTDSGDLELADMTAEDVTGGIGLTDKLFAEIIGIDMDPKDFRQAAGIVMKQAAEDKLTETSLSEESPTLSTPNTSTS